VIFPANQRKMLICPDSRRPGLEQFIFDVVAPINIAEDVRPSIAEFISSDVVRV
jgi:hypothetical protein